MPQADLGPALELLRRIWAVDHALQAVSRGMTKRLGVSGVERVALRVLAVRGPMTAGALAKSLHLDPSSLTPVLRRLETLGLLERAKDGSDARRQVIGITAGGRARSTQLPGTAEGAVTRVLEGASPDDVAATHRVLGALGAELDRIRDGWEAEPRGPTGSDEPRSRPEAGDAPSSGRRPRGS